MTFRALRLLLLTLAAVTGVSCTGYPRGWDVARQNAGPEPASGAWEGQWRSTATGHSGLLRCVVDPPAGGVREFHYRASWARVLSGGWDVKCQGTRLPSGAWAFRGDARVGALGTFRHHGQIAGDDFQAEYESPLDRGTLQLRRVR